MDGELPDSAADADGWLLTGSRHGAYEDLPWIPPLEDFIREIHAGGRPMVGICFGHQIIAKALGGKVEKYDGGWAVLGHQDYTFSDGVNMRLNAWHQEPGDAASRRRNHHRKQRVLRQCSHANRR